MLNITFLSENVQLGLDMIGSDQESGAEQHSEFKELTLNEKKYQNAKQYQICIRICTDFPYTGRDPTKERYCVPNYSKQCHSCNNPGIGCFSVTKISYTAQIGINSEI